MSLAQRFERRLESLVGTAFARVFKGQVEPVEIGTALQREATDKRNVMGNGEVLAPNRYRVTLSSSDHERLLPWQAQLTTSLAELVQEHLDENGWRTIGDVVVLLALDESLHTGVFGVASRMESSAPPRRRPHDSLSLPPSEPDSLATVGAVAQAAPAPAVAPSAGYAPAGASPVNGAVAEPIRQPYIPPRPRACVLVDGTQQLFELHAGTNVIGRSNDANLQLLDQGVSRRHVDISYDGTNATLRDLGSTNGTTVNGHPAAQAQLRHGDVIRIGHTRLVFQQENG